AERTWTVAGHHYALVTVDGLAAGAATPYEVRLDGAVVWPLPDSGRPPSRIRTHTDGAVVQIAFGSCRYASAAAVLPDHRFDADALVGYARKIAAVPEDRW